MGGDCTNDFLAISRTEKECPLTFQPGLSIQRATESGETLVVRFGESLLSALDTNEATAAQLSPKMRDAVSTVTGSLHSAIGAAPSKLESLDSNHTSPKSMAQATLDPKSE